MAHQHMLGYLVPYHGMVDLHKRVRRLFSYNKIWMRNTGRDGEVMCYQERAEEDE